MHEGETRSNKTHKNPKIMVRTTSLKTYKRLKAKGVTVQLVTKQELNPHTKTNF